MVMEIAFCLNMMVVVLEFVIFWINQEPGCGGINPAIGITNYVGRLSGTFIRHDANNNGWDPSDVQGYGKKILARIKDRVRKR